MTTQVEEYSLLLAGLATLEGLAHGGGNGMTALGRGHDALGAREEYARLETLQLRDVYTMHIAVLDELRHDHSGSMVAQTARMDIGRFEVVAQGEHGQQRSISRLVAEVVFKLASGQLGAARWLGGDKFGLSAVEDGMAHEGERQSAKVAAASEAGYHHVGIFLGHLHLLFCLKSYHCLVQ